MLILKIDRSLDVKGLVCPVPVLKTKQIISKMNSGQILEILATDKAAKDDIPSWAQREGHDVLDVAEHENIFTFYLRKK